LAETSEFVVIVELHTPQLVLQNTSTNVQFVNQKDLKQFQSNHLMNKSHQHRFFSRNKLQRALSEDPEIAKIMQKKMEEMLKPKPEPIIEPGIIDLNDSNFDQTISAENPTLVDFWAEWCGPCKSMHPIFESLSKKYPNVKFARVNVDQNQNISMKYAVQSIPTFIMFKSGQIVDKMMGAVGAPGIHMICKKHSS